MKFPSTLSVSPSLFAMLAFSAHADEKRIVQTVSHGNIQYNKPSHTIRQDGRIIETDAIGNEQYDKQQFQIKEDKTYPVDSPGNIQYDKPQFETK